MNQHDADIDVWREIWIDTAPSVPSQANDIRVAARDVVSRGRRRMFRRAASEALVALLWTAAAIALIRLRPDPALAVLGGGIIVFVAIACVFSVWNAAGTWQPRGESVRDFVVVAIERCRRDLRASRFGFWFAAIETVLLFGWLAWTRDRDVLPELSRQPDAWLILPVIAPGAVIVMLLMWRRRAMRELTMLERLREDLDERA